MNLKLILSLATLVATLPLHALPTLATEHVDIGVAFDLGAFNLHIHDETNDIEYAPAAAILQVNPQGSELIPNNPLYSLLGTPGVDSVWRLPKVQNPNLLFLGVGSGEIDPGILDGDVFTFSLISVSNLNGGKFTIYDVDGFNVPTVIFNSGDGINGADSIVLPTGGHTDFNFTFSAPGQYEIAFKVDGLDGGVSITQTATYTFAVVPEPASALLLGSGALALLGRRRRAQEARG